MLGGIGGRRRRGGQRMRWLDGITDLTDVSLSELRDLLQVTVEPAAILRELGAPEVSESDSPGILVLE